jgi:LmbE family N-acetylglucosaminyl deacetylase
MSQNRRTFLTGGAAAFSVIAFPGSLQGKLNKFTDKKLRVVCVGGHPDDPESGCGGTLASFSAGGHEVTVIYLTRGEAGISGKSSEEAAGIRSREAGNACRILGVKPVFAGQIDGDTVVNNEWTGKIRKLIDDANPDIVFTHWPVDSHKDHQCASLMTIQSWIRSDRKYELYFFEVCLGDQTQMFKPTDYVDITRFREQKRKAVYCHESQNPAGIYEAEDCNHTLMEKFRGMEAGVPAAEAFVRCNSAHSVLQM